MTGWFGRGERGSASGWMLGVAALAVAAACALLVVSAAASTQAGAARSAELSALAASDVARGLPTASAVQDPCAVAREVAARNGASVSECAVLRSGPTQVEQGASVRVSVTQRGSTPWTGWFKASAQAYAGVPPGEPEPAG